MTDNPLPCPFVHADLYAAMGQAGLGVDERAVLLTMAYRAGVDGVCYESAVSIAATLGVSRRRVGAAQARLVEAGFFVAERQPGFPIRYRWRGRARGADGQTVTGDGNEEPGGVRQGDAPLRHGDAGGVRHHSAPLRHGDAGGVRHSGAPVRHHDAPLRQGDAPLRHSGARSESQDRKGRLASQPAREPATHQPPLEAATPLAAWDLDGEPPPAMPGASRPTRGRHVAAADDPAVSDEGSLTGTLTGRGSAKYSRHEAHAFFRSLWDPRRLDYSQVRDRLLGWYMLHGRDTLMALWQEALTNPDGKVPFWWFVNALGGEVHSRVLAAGAKPARPTPPPASTLAHDAPLAPPGIVEGGLVRLPDGTEARVDALTNRGLFAMVEGRPESFPTKILTPIAGVAA